MGVFIYSNKLLNTEKPKAVYESKGHRNIFTEMMSDTLLYSNKVLVDNRNFLSIEKEGSKDYILGIGCYFYNKRHGFDALRLIYDDIEEILINNTVYGHYAFVVKKEGVTYILSDMSGCIRLYYYNQDNRFMISSSLLSIISCLDFPKFDKIRLGAFICGGSGNEIPFVEGIELFNPLEYVVINTDGNVEWKKRPENKPQRLETLDDAVDKCVQLFQQQLEQLSSIKNEEIAIEATGGLDCRLNLSNFRKGKFNYQLVNYPQFKPDTEMARMLSKNLNVKLHTIHNIPCGENYDSLFGEFDLCFNYFRQYPNARWNADCDFQFSGARGECLDLPDIYTDGDNISAMSNPRLSFLIPNLTLGELMRTDIQKSYTSYMLDFMNKRGFTVDEPLSEKDQLLFTQILHGQLTGDYLYNSAANSMLYYYQIYNEYHFNHEIMDINFSAKAGRKLSIALIKKFDLELASYPFLSRRRTKRNSINEVEELPIQYKSYNKIKQILPKFIVNYLYGIMGRKFSLDLLHKIDMSQYKDVIQTEQLIKYPNLYSYYLQRLFSVEVIRLKYNISF